VLKSSTTLKLFKNSFQSQGLFALLISFGENLKMFKNDFEIFVHFSRQPMTLMSHNSLLRLEN
jgi:hypothetical protein